MWISHITKAVGLSHLEISHVLWNAKTISLQIICLGCIILEEAVSTHNLNTELPLKSPIYQIK